MTLTKLRDIHCLKDIPEPAYIPYSSHSSNDRSEGTCDHCPLHTAGNTAVRMEGAMALVIGVAECGYYMKNGAGSRGGQINKLMNVILDWHDVTFGCTPKVEAAMTELMAEYHPEVVFLITTCVPEVCGDDFEAIAEALSGRYQIPVPVVHTEHFKTRSASAGRAGVLTACASLINSHAQGVGVNILGSSKEDFSHSELGQILEKADVSIAVTIPDCSVAELRTAARARLNIVMEEAALPLAQIMEQRFAVPYVVFQSHIFPDRILTAYETIFAHLNLPLPETLIAAYYHAVEILARVGNAVLKKEFFVGNTAFPLYELGAFLVKQDAVLLLLEVHEWTNNDNPDLQTILTYADPYVTRQLVASELAHWQPESTNRLYICDQSAKHGRGIAGFAAISTFAEALITGEYSSERSRREKRHGRKQPGHKQPENQKRRVTQ